MRRVREYFEEQIAKKAITGAAYSVSVGDELIGDGVLGHSDCEGKKALSRDSVFRLASMTKPVTAVAVMICRDRGLLDLDEPIGRYLDGFSHGGVGEMLGGVPTRIGEAREITLRDILTHTSGLGSGEVGDYQQKGLPFPASLSSNAMAWRGKLLDFPVGAKSAYSPVVAFELAAFAVEAVTKRPYAEFLEDELFSRLGMRDTTYLPNKEQAARLVDLPAPDGSGGLVGRDIGLRGHERFAEGYHGGSAGLFSTLDDYAAFAKMLANLGEYNGERILSEEAVREMSRPQFDTWGLGMYVRRVHNKYQPLERGSFGWSGAYGTHFWVEPNSRTVAVLMLNSYNCGGSASPFSAAFERLVASRNENEE